MKQNYMMLAVAAVGAYFLFGNKAKAGEAGANLSSEAASFTHGSVMDEPMQSKPLLESTGDNFSILPEPSIEQRIMPLPPQQIINDGRFITPPIIPTDSGNYRGVESILSFRDRVR